MAGFADIPVRDNGDDVVAAWWNTIRSKLIEVFGSGVTSEVSSDIADAQFSFADISDFTLDGNEYSWGKFEYSIYRDDGSSDERREVGTIELKYKQRNDTWEMIRRSDGDALNRSNGGLQVVNNSKVAQVQYQSDSMGGTYTGKITWKTVSTLNVES